MRTPKTRRRWRARCCSFIAEAPRSGDDAQAHGAFRRLDSAAVILVPVKNLSAAKQRLAAVLDQPSRTALAQAMLHDVLTALHTGRTVRRSRVVTSDPYAVEAGGGIRIRNHSRPGESRRNRRDRDGDAGLCGARRGQHAGDSGGHSADSGWELEEILKHAPAEGSVLVPAADGRGTNAAFRRPANLFPLRFGNDSFKPHHAAAQATGKPCVVLQLARHCGGRG